MHATTIGIDLAKDVFELAIRRGGGTRVARQRLTRRQFAQFVDTLPPEATVVMEACATAHYWARRCQAQGAEVRLLPAQHVRPYVRRNKTDRADAEALLEAHRCASLHAVPVKTPEQQAIQTLHRVRQQWQTLRTARINALRAILREHGLLTPIGPSRLAGHVTAVLADPDSPLPMLLRPTLQVLVEELRQTTASLTALDRQLETIVRTHPVARRLQAVRGVGPVTATALVGSVPHVTAFKRGRQFASWLGLTPRVHASGTRRWCGGVSKQGDRYLRTLLIHGGRAVLRAAHVRATRAPATLSELERWALALAKRRGHNCAAVALANKLARIIWVVWAREGEPHRA